MLEFFLRVFSFVGFAFFSKASSS